MERSVGEKDKLVIGVRGEYETMPPFFKLENKENTR